MKEMNYFFDALSVFRGMPFELDLVLRLVISALAGALVGYERKRRQKEAGMRTHCMVAVGAALFAIVSKYGYFDVTVFDSISADASRVAANIVTGVCFLGAGMIFVKNKSISGLTTAAGIWVVSAIGLAFGSGLYNMGLVVTIIMVMLQYVLHKPLVMIEGSSAREITCVVENWDDIDKLKDVLKRLDSSSYYSCIEKKADGSALVKFVVRIEHGDLVDDIYAFMQKNPYIKSISN